MQKICSCRAFLLHFALKNHKENLTPAVKERPRIIPRRLFKETIVCVLIVRSVITAPLSTKRSRRAAAEEFDCTLKILLRAVF